MVEKHTPPQFAQLGGSNSYHCPHCGVYAMQRFYVIHKTGHSNSQEVPTLGTSYCDSCNQYAVWYVPEGKMIFPNISIAPKPLDDMPDDVKTDYEEARQIVNASPRGSAALLRLCVQKLMPHLGEKGKDINNEIANLVKKGLPVPIQQALDSLRVIGNNAVHPGQIMMYPINRTVK